jgi:hypothetical protein
MADGFTCPGVYVQEQPSTFSSVRHMPTAVPAFFCITGEFRLLFDYDKPYVKLASWQDVEMHITRRVTAMVAARKNEDDFKEGNRQDLLHGWEAEKYREEQAQESAKQSASAAPASKSEEKSETGALKAARGKFAAWLRDELNYDWLIARSLRAYFENGGGPCYVLAGVNEDALNEAVVMTLKDVTLVVQAGTSVGVDQEVVDSDDLDVVSLTSALTEQDPVEDLGIFFLLDIDIKGDQFDGQLASDLPTSSFGAAYGPYLNRRIRKEETLSKKNDFDVLVPPSAVMAGIYCKADRERGAWKAPANIDVAGPLRAAYEIPEEEASRLNAGNIRPESIAEGKAIPSVNVIRCVRGSALTVWGARTLTTDQPDFRYVSVRRLFNSVKRDILSTLASSAYEPNCSSTWERARAAIDHYLYELWKAGALLGEQSQDAYTIAIGLGDTMSKQDVAAGLMKVKIGLAAVRPAEFVILQFGQKVRSATGHS